VSFTNKQRCHSVSEIHKQTEAVILSLKFTNKQRCHSERTGPRTFFSSGVVSEESAVVRSRSFQRTTEPEPQRGNPRTPRLTLYIAPGTLRAPSISQSHREMGGKPRAFPFAALKRSRVPHDISQKTQSVIRTRLCNSQKKHRLSFETCLCNSQTNRGVILNERGPERFSVRGW